LRIALSPNRTDLGEKARSAAEENAVLLLAPLALDDWSDALDQAETSDGPFAAEVASIAASHGIAVYAGFIEHCTSGNFNAALLCDAEGHMLCCYRQTHMPEGARSHGLIHGQWLSQARINGTTMGLMIGEDLLHPEAARSLAVSGSEMLLVLEDGRLDAEQLRILTSARALENHMPVVIAGTSLCGAASADGHFHTSESVDVTRHLETSREGRHMRLTRRRPRLYNAITLIDPDEDKPPL
jgi:predicted amidohydrolase